jgi:hypothetical protein
VNQARNQYKNHIVVIEFVQKVNQRIDQPKMMNSLPYNEEDLWVVAAVVGVVVAAEENNQLNHKYIE